MIRILLVEDDKDLNLIVCRHLNNRGYYAIGVATALEALDHLLAYTYDLIIKVNYLVKINAVLMLG